MKRAAGVLLGLVSLAGCELLPGPHDGGHSKVPGSYLDARSSPGHRAHLALEGEKQLFCHDCHFIADAGFSAAAVKPCAECHERQQQHHHPLGAGVGLTCFSCHIFRAQGPGRWGCARCHSEQTVVHSDRCSACHRPHGAPFTRAADCGQCHDVTVEHGKGEKADVAGTCMTCHPHHTKATVAAARCTSCHAANQAALFPKGHTACSTCHTSHAFTKGTAKDCRGCHAEQHVIASEKHGACTTCHDPHSGKAAPKTCESCHTKVHVAHPPTLPGQTCLGCHPVHSATVTKAADCSTCHALGDVVHANDVPCFACHKDQHAGKPSRAGLCESCHREQHALVKNNAGHAKCDACHLGLPHAPREPPPCLTCHAQKTPPQKGHTQCASCHQSHSAQVIKRCTDCHDKPLPGLHAVKKHQQCESCHRPHEPEPGVGPPTCKTCHPAPSAKNHPTPPQQCVGCHLFTPRR
ncbi:MAG: hypothetical protein JNK82_38885 [Myxococcaceae bacterium]|nr:hypothetical protein [Myxococcaceae bacterium]